MSTEKLYKQFKAKAEAVSAEVHRTKNAEEALEFINSFIKDFSAEEKKEVKTIWAETPSLINYKDKLKGLKNVYYAEDIPKHAEEALIGVSEMDAAIAESGTLAQDATDVLKRLVSTLPFTHIAVVSTKNLTANISDYLSEINHNIPGFTAFITGPSRTADIERVLTIGVHGPERLVIIFVDEDGGDK